MDRHIGNDLYVYGFALAGSSVNFAAVYESQFAHAKQFKTYKDRIIKKYLGSYKNGSTYR